MKQILLNIVTTLRIFMQRNKKKNKSWIDAKYCINVAMYEYQIL